MSMPDDHRFLKGPFAPVSEEVTAFDLPVTGRLPAELSGRYLRNGPNPLGLDDPNYHWFLGAGMVHGVRLRDGRAEWYRNRWVRSKAVAAARGEPWPGGPVHEGMDFAANTHIISHAGRTLATAEARVTAGDRLLAHGSAGVLILPPAARTASTARPPCACA